MNRRLPEQLAARLQEALPGPMVGSQFEPRPRDRRGYDDPPPDARAAAVMILLYPHKDSWHLPLTLRPAELSNHAGQVSLPGGAVEPGETAWQAAAREFHEELGAEGHEIERLGRLSPIYVSASNFNVVPSVGVSYERPDLVPNPGEVAELLEIPLGHLLDPANLCHFERESGGQSFRVPHFRWQSYRIWGATCMILGELVTVLRGNDV
jgi:8-oxo-dGTP pyrophosphatase MutT (NUDIX family)